MTAGAAMSGAQTLQIAPVLAAARNAMIVSGRHKGARKIEITQHAEDEHGEFALSGAARPRARLSRSVS